MPARSKTSILIVDDDPRNLVALQAVLQDMKHHLVPATSGDEALRQVLKHNFAVILLDAQMPGLDGFETARMIRRHPPSRHTPIIFVTGAYEDASSVFRGYEAGGVDYIVKPVVPEVLRSKITVFVELFDKNAALAAEVAERKQTEERLRALTAHVQSVREEERTRIAREIHDELGQALTGLKMDLTWLASRLPPDQNSLIGKTESMSSLIDSTIQTVRDIASGMRPEVLDEVGLAAAIGWQAREFQKRSGIRCQVTLPPESARVDQETGTAVFRVFQEVLTNVARHANATRVEILMQFNPNTLLLDVQDNGKGISESDTRNPKSLGLLGMRERVLLIGGKIEITGSNGRGTKVTVVVPLR